MCVGISHSKSVVTVQRAFRAQYAKDPPADKTIRARYKQFTGTWCLYKQKSSGRPLTAEDDVEPVRTSFLHSRIHQRDTKSNSQLLALVSFVFKDKNSKTYSHTLKC